MKKILFSLAFMAAGLSAGFAQVAATSAGTDSIAPSPHDGDSLAPANNVTPEMLPHSNIPEVFSFENDASLYYLTHKSTLPLPDEIQKMLMFGKTDEAISQLEAYKKTVKTKDPLQLLLLDAEFYEMFRHDQNLGKTYQALVQKLKNEYGDRAEVIRFEIDELMDRSPKNIIEIAERMIKADPKYLPAYFIRGREYFNLEQTDKFCEDFDKLPEVIKSNDANYKQSCKK